MTLILFASGCSNLVTKYISSQQSYGYENIASDAELSKQGYIKSEYCSKTYKNCISYLIAKPLNDKHLLRYDVAIDVNQKTEKTYLKLTRAEVQNDFNGTIVVIHGFKASKEFMANTAAYFRFLGFNVIVPDLPGHGDSSGEISFGIKDAKIINELLNSSVDLAYPLYVLGNSMGAVAATYLAKENDYVSGIILQAPMTIFDNATVNYSLNHSSIITRLFSEKAIRQGAIKALDKADVFVEQTDIKPILSSLDTPVMILASTSDQVAPFDYFKSLSTENVSVFKIDNRSHPGMNIIGNKENLHIQEWLISKANKQINQDK
ncbi:MAG: alpha/beta hydrolase [Gammaproteobacteria bacterium]|nr:alpha/beta hydrolase [Gammaproteobacteria bacterium]